MKRLLAYLFMVLGLGLAFNNSVFAENKYILDIKFCKGSWTGSHILPTLLKSCKKAFERERIESTYSEYKNFVNIGKKNHGWTGAICLRKDDSKRSKSLVTKILTTKYSCGNFGSDYMEVKHDGHNFYVTESTQIAKKEPKKKEKKVAKKEKKKAKKEKE